MENYKRRTNYLPWIFFGMAAVGFVALGFFLLVTVIIGAVSIEDDSFPTSGNLAVVEIKGVISDPTEILRALSKVEKDSKVKAVVLRVNSPGGEVAPSQEIHDKIKVIAKKKKVIASMGSVAASGGYYVCAPAHRIVANPGTITGSIGVVLELLIAKDLLKKLYLDFRVIKSGEVKDMGSPLRDLTPKEVKILSDMASNIHDQFILAVANGRKLKVEEVKKLADGRIFSGEQALKVKLVDELGGLDRAVKVAAKLSGISGEPKVYYPLKKKKKVWDLFAQSIANVIDENIKTGNLLPKPMYLYGR